MSKNQINAGDSFDQFYFEVIRLDKGEYSRIKRNENLYSQFRKLMAKLPKQYGEGYYFQNIKKYTLKRQFLLNLEVEKIRFTKHKIRIQLELDL